MERKSKIKNRFITARVDITTEQKILEYAKETDTFMGDLVRLAVKEYMWSHPAKLIKERKENGAI